uniref:Putative secreted peptide n=1 Tax=Anopheles braziliensis TaxID=58242 RepID=A0A2M3ZQI5_9DIPT
MGFAGSSLVLLRLLPGPVRGLLGEWDLVMVLVGVRICEIFSRKSSLNDLARRASLLPRMLPLGPNVPDVPCESLLFPISPEPLTVELVLAEFEPLPRMPV